jgi:hypothetical protein
MGKAAGAMIAVSTVGAAAVTLLGSVLGTYTEATTLALAGLGLLASSSVLESRLTVPGGMAKEA